MLWKILHEDWLDYGYLDVGLIDVGGYERLWGVFGFRVPDYVGFGVKVL